MAEQGSCDTCVNFVMMKITNIMSVIWIWMKMIW